MLVTRQDTQCPCDRAHKIDIAALNQSEERSNSTVLYEQQAAVQVMIGEGTNGKCALMTRNYQMNTARCVKTYLTADIIALRASDRLQQSRNSVCLNTITNDRK